MKIEININPEIKDPYAVVHTDKITDEVQRVVSACEASDRLVVFDQQERMIILASNQVHMVRIEDGKTFVYANEEKYAAKKRLYEIGEMLGPDCLQIAKSTIVNIKEISFVEPYFSGMMNAVLKNGQSEFISRKYLPAVKQYLGI